MKHPSVVAAATDVPAFDDATPMPEAAPENEVSSQESSPFEGIAAPLQKALKAQGFSKLTVVQEAVLASDAAGRDLQISSQTGSGKTVALGIAVAPRLIEAATAGGGSRPLAALVIVPTRELAVQVSGELRWLFASVPGLGVECVTGGTSVGQERRRLERRPTVVVGTPGRLLDHIRTGAVDCSNVNEIVLDEADRMLDMGFREELEAILEAAPKERNTHLVSATFAKGIQKLAHKYQNNPLSVEGTRLGAANEDIEHVGHLIRMSDRYDAIVNLVLLTEDQRALIFVNTRAQASELAEKLAGDGFAAAPISGELEQAQRTRTLDAFRKGVVTILVATDVAARGLDIPDVSLVIHTDAPMDSESYTHRAGRTGRAGNKGCSVLLVSPQRRRKVDYLLSRAKVHMQWRDVPTAASVEKTLAKRARKRLHDSLATAPEPSESQLKHANGLLEEMDPAVLVARLVALSTKNEKATPRKVEAMTALQSGGREERRGGYQDRQQRSRGFEHRGGGYRDDRGGGGRGGYRDDRGGPRSNGPAGRGYNNRDDRGGYRNEREAPRSGGYRDDRQGGYRDDRSAPRGGGYRDDRGGGYRDDRAPRGGYREDSRGPARAPRGRSDDRAARFEINWGARGGATPQRLVALLCRRGDVSSRMIGSIDIDSHGARFEISDRVARQFEQSASMPDSRDPDLYIRRAR